MSWRPIPLAALLLVAFAAELGAQHQHGGVMYHAPRWSPDGQWILVSANLDSDTEIYLLRSDGRGKQQLTRNEVPNDFARWSDDGRRILFRQTGPEGEAQFSMAIDGTDVRPEPRDSVTARTPDGKVLLFESVREGRGRLFVMGAHRTRARAISGDRHAEQGSFSPDGRRLVWEERDAMHEQIEESQVVVARADGSEPSIAYMRDRADGGADIWIMNRDGADRRCLTCAATFR